MTRSWTIGSSPECDVLVNHATVSGRHCRLTRDADGYEIEDLSSTNGTYLNGIRVTGKVRVTRVDVVTLAQTVPFPWPEKDSQAGPQTLRIGREPDNDIVVSLLTVSGFHAKIVWNGKPGEAWIEDLGSSNGTSIGSPDRRVTGSTVTASDTIFLGTHPIPVAQLLARFGPEAIAVGGALVPVAMMTTPVPAPVPAGQVSTPLTRSWWDEIPVEFAWINANLGRLSILLVQGPLAATMIVLCVTVSAPGAVAAVLSWLGISAIWFGLSNAVLGHALIPRSAEAGRKPGVASQVSLFTMLGVLCFLQCAITWLIVARLDGLSGPVVPTLLLLTLASAVGLTLGQAVVSIVPDSKSAFATLPLGLLLLCLLGGQLWPIQRMPVIAKVFSNVLPSRWAFEGLLLLESGRQQPTIAPDVPGGSRTDAVVEDYFPADNEQMGVKADLTALLTMFVGLAALATFISESRKPAES